MSSPDEAECPVKERCWEQREAQLGEPRCVVCGRFGEYICDVTDDDVCSTECKSALLAKIVANSNKKAFVKPTHHPAKVPFVDECFYVRDNTDHQVEVMRKNIDVHVAGGSLPAPVMSFASLDLPEKLQQNLETEGYEIPTPVQMQTIPAAMAKRNLLVSASTGSGKTASYLVPIIAHCSKIRVQNVDNDRAIPLAIVLTPTRELCVQVEGQAKMLGKGLPFKTALVVGGDAMPQQVYRISQGVELIVATPGRLIDLLAKHDFDLSDISILVLDEVDCMLQKGFLDQVMQISIALSNAQVLMFSATILPEIEKMPSTIAKDVVFVSCGKKGNKPNESVKQVVIWVEPKQKKQKLFDILTSKQHFRPPVVVFVESRMGADLLSTAITSSTGLRALAIHGEKPMKERREILRLFLTGDVPVIVATGLLGRGVDLLKVKQVVLFDMPKSIAEYVHEVGRASRMGEEGTAFVFVCKEDKNLFKDLVQILRSSGAAIPRELANSYYTINSQPFNSRQKRRKY